jgi:hypothetical protein
VLVYAVALVVALVVVPLTRGSFRRLAGIEVQRVWLLFAGLAIQVALELVDFPAAHRETAGFGLLLASYLALLGFCTSNLRLAGMGVVTIGVALNAFVIAANQGMPYRVAEGEEPAVTVKHRPERPGDVLPVLGDRIVLPDPVAASISFGDLILAVGLVELCYRNSRVPRRARRRVPHPSEQPAPDPSTGEVWLRTPAAELAAAHHAVERVEDRRVVEVART